MLGRFTPTDEHGMAQAHTALHSRLAALRSWLPEGRELPEEVWARRHRGVRVLLIVQAAALVPFGVARGRTLIHTSLEVSIVIASALLSRWRVLGRKSQAVVATYGLLVTSALLVHFADGSIEAHFHFFVMLMVISLYQDWTVYLLALGFVVVHHGAMGALAPTGVYNHADAIASPWKWAAVHGGFVLAAAVANLFLWRANESMHEESEISLASAITAKQGQDEALSLVNATLESTADGILVVGTDGRITSFNQQFLRMWRIPDDIAASRDDQAAIGFVLDQLADPAEFESKVRELYDHPEAESFDTLEFKDGRAFERYSKPQRVKGETVGRVWSFRDVTQRKQLDEIKDSLLSAVSHEMRTPLTTVLGAALTLAQHADNLSGEERHFMYERLAANATKLDRMLSDMLDLDRLSRGIVQPRRQETDLAALVTRIVNETGLLLELDIHVACEPIVADVDAAKVERILENLLINAARHTPAGTSVWIDVRALAGGVQLSVEDAGPGVPDDIKAVIFEPFRQGPNQRSHSPGVGIGLSLVSRFAALHGGAARVEDRDGGGAAFRVVLPCRVVAHAA